MHLQWGHSHRVQERAGAAHAEGGARIHISSNSKSSEGVALPLGERPWTSGSPSTDFCWLVIGLEQIVPVCHLYFPTESIRMETGFHPWALTSFFKVLNADEARRT